LIEVRERDFPFRKKAEQGIYPGRARIGYRNNSVTRAIDVDPERAPIVKRIFDLYASGEHSLITLRRTMLHEWGIRLSRSYFEKILKNRFYLGYFVWQGVEYKGTHTPLIATELYGRVQDVLAGRHKLKHRKHAFAFAGLLRCAHDGCTVTAELQKRKYVYYRCSHGRGKCPLPYMREQGVSDRLGELLKDIYVPETVAHTIVASLQADSARNEMERQQRMDGVEAAMKSRRFDMCAPECTLSASRDEKPRPWSPTTPHSCDPARAPASAL
jgi:site-specific DNA recombinase